IASRAKKGRVLILAEKEELIFQAADPVKRVTGEHPDIEKAEYKADRSLFSRSRTVVASQATLRNPKRLERFDPRQFSLLIVDEAHHAVAESYRPIFDHFRDSKILGVTATPKRTDKKRMGE